MRELIITRRKTSVACLGKSKVYIEDPECSDLVINNTPCRFLGTLKNGETQYFEISEDEAKVFVIFDKASKSYSNDYFNIPSGRDDVELTGRCHFNPLTGNAFRFDFVTDPDIIANRRRSMLKGSLVTLGSLTVGFAIGFAIVYWLVLA